jgi:hypothetical protein
MGAAGTHSLALRARIGFVPILVAGVISRRRGVAAGREGVFPQESSRLLVQVVEALILRAADEHQAASRHGRAAEGLDAGPRDPAGSGLDVYAEGDRPGELAGRPVVWSNEWTVGLGRVAGRTPGRSVRRRGLYGGADPRPAVGERTIPASVMPSFVRAFAAHPAVPREHPPPDPDGISGPRPRRRNGANPEM